MIVVSDTSPLTALLTVGQQDILPQLFDQVVIPEAVRDELFLNHPQLPDWLKVVGLKNPAGPAKYLQNLDAGEA